MRTKTFAVACLVGLAAWGVIPAAAAEKGDKMVRFGVVYGSPTDDYSSGMQTTELDGSLGFQGAFEFRLTDRLGLEPGVTFQSYDLTVDDPVFQTDGDTDLIAVTVNLNFHFKRESGLDCYLGPTVGYAMWDDLNLDIFALPTEVDDDFLFGATGGINVPFGEGGWSFHAGLGYWFLDVPAASGDIGVNPIQVEAGLSYSF